MKNCKKILSCDGGKCNDCPCKKKELNAGGDVTTEKYTTAENVKHGMTAEDIYRDWNMFTGQ